MVRKTLIISYALLLLAFTAPLLYRLISRQLPEKPAQSPSPDSLSTEAVEMVTACHDGNNQIKNNSQYKSNYQHYNICFWCFFY